MSNLLYLLRGRSPSALKMASAVVLPPSLAGELGRRYSDDSGGIIDKDQAVSTAEEFLRQAKEKTDSATEKAKETVEDAKEAVLGETKQEKEKLKETIENGNCSGINQD